MVQDNLKPFFDTYAISSSGFAGIEVLKKLWKGFHS